MIDATTCPRCSAPLPADAPAGICPTCLLAKGLETTAGYDDPPARLPQPDEQFGPYRIGRLLGSGGMGAVFAATHLESGRCVALKVLNHKLESPQHRQRFLREGRLAASVNHPHSVYIYGAEEIAGTPVIAMELAPGGTLQDRVKREGPLPVGEAVDVVLQMIDGLEAAESAGVLHRDVKPSNCFVDADGAVRIGDFGLSISTAPRAETNLTESGIFLGTPVFASPEQLRGDELDVRSDIYSVGVTLFYLLTGRTPFEAKQMVQLLATVLERPAPSPAEYRSGIPAGLAKVVQRCLQKQSRQRFSSYAELRQALLPYRSAAPTPATLGFRAVAYALDGLVLTLVAAILPVLWARDWTTWNEHFLAVVFAEPGADETLMLLGLLGVLIQVGYFILGEGLVGTTAGKRICQLRVVRGDRETPGLGRAFLRAGVFFTAYLLPWWACYAVDLAAGTSIYGAAEPWIITASVLVTLALFSTARRSNGYAALHELASGTRVVRAPMHQRRPVLSTADESLPEPQSEEKIGPYHVLGPLESDPSQPFLLAYDTQLLRKVWIRKRPPAAPPVAQHLRELSRVGRLRWLNGHRSPDGGWDAYEAPTGKPLLQVIGKRQPWRAVSFWLLDLAEELSAGLADDTLPAVLELDRVWITADGRAKLLDFRAPRLFAETAAGATAITNRGNEAVAAIFLKRVAIAALEGRVTTAEEAELRDVAAPIPLSARALLHDLGRSAGAPLPVAPLKALTAEAATVSGAKRAGALAACLLGPMFFAAIFTIFYYTESQALREHPKVGVLAGYLDYYNSLDENDERRGAVEIIIADRYRQMVTDPEVWSNPAIYQLLTEPGDRGLAQNIVESHPAPSDEEVAAAEAQLAPWKWEIEIWTTASDQFYSVRIPIFFLSVFTGLLVLLVVAPSLLSALLLGDSLLLRLLDIAVVSEDGAPASRLQVLGRSALLWSAVLLAIAALTMMVAYGRASVAAILLIGWIAASLLAERGFDDRLPGTHLVPR